MENLGLHIARGKGAAVGRDEDDAEQVRIDFREGRYVIGVLPLLQRSVLGVSRINGFLRVALHLRAERRRAEQCALPAQVRTPLTEELVSVRS